MKPSLLLVGLGNPGAQYERTRHNIGFRAIDVLSDSFGESDWSEKPKFLCSAQEGRIITAPILLVKPNTYMNRSGECIAKLVSFYKLDPATQMIVLCDDIDLPLGDIRVRRKGGPGTHNGLKSIVHHLGETFPRIRIGLGTPPAETDLSAWVLSTFLKEEEEKITEALDTLPTVVRDTVLE